MTSLAGHHLVAADASGNFVIVWHSDQEGDGDVNYGIFGQRYDSAGVPAGLEFHVNSFTTDDQLVPSVASDPSGNFVVVWSSDNQDGHYSGIFGQRFDSAGVAQGAEFGVNTQTLESQFSPSVAMDASGNFVVVWQSYGQDGYGHGVFGQRFDSSGVALGSEFQVNSYTSYSQWFPSVASDAAGNFVVVWSSDLQDGDSHGVFGRRFDSSGVAQGDEFRVSSYTTNNQWFPSVASDASGNFVVVWESTGQDGSGYGVFAQWYDSLGMPQGSEFRANSYTPDGQLAASVTADASGNFVITWSSYGQDGFSFGVFGQRYDSAGVPQGTEFQINSFTTDRQVSASVAATGTDKFVVAWESLNQDGSSTASSASATSSVVARPQFTSETWTAAPRTSARDGGLRSRRWSTTTPTVRSPERS